MNNALAIVFRLPCRGFTTPIGSAWTRIPRDGLLCPSSMRVTRVHERHQLSKRSFGSASWQLAKFKAKKNTPAPTPKSAKPAPKSVLRSSQPQARAPLPKDEVEAESTKSTEKATVLLGPEQVATIFGHGLKFEQGMDLLQDLQYRRVTGSLSDKGLEFPEHLEYTADQKASALEWLRENYPVDEEAAALEYAEELAEEERKTLENRALKLRFYKTDEGKLDGNEKEVEEEIYVDESYDKTPLRPDQTRDITSGSALAARKDYVEASRKKAKIEAEKVAEEYEARGEKPPEPYKGHDLVVAKKTSLEQRRVEKHEKWERMAKEAELDTDEMTREDRSAFSRLWAPVSFGAVVIGGLWVYANNYEPPKSSMRVFPSITPATATIATIAGINLIIWLMWRHPNAWKMMNRNFLLQPGNPRAGSVLLGLFSHQTIGHLWWNMGALYLIGSAVHEEVGRGTFLSLYLTSGILGYLFSLTTNVLTRSYLSATLGASAAVFGLTTAYFTISPTRNIWDKEFPAWLPVVLMVAYEVYRLRLSRGVIDGIGGGTDHLTHLGGMVSGAIYGYILRKRMERERAEDGSQAVQVHSKSRSPLSTTATTSS